MSHEPHPGPIARTARRPDPRGRLGATGERLAEGYLTSAGYHLLGRNYRTRHGELDLVMANSRCIVFCEVKTRMRAGRAGPEGPLDAIGPGKRRQVRLMAREWLGSPGTQALRGNRPDLRFDAVGVVLAASGELLSLEHVEGAF